MHREYRLRPLRHGARDARGVEVERVGIDVDEHRATAAELDGVRRRGKRVRRDDHLVSESDPESHHREMEGRRARRDDNGICRAASTGERALELAHFRAHREHAGRNDLGHGCELGLADVRARETDGLVHEPVGRFSRYQSIVRSSPTSSSTVASNPSSSRAFPMFGMRSSTST